MIQERLLETLSDEMKDELLAVTANPNVSQISFKYQELLLSRMAPKSYYDFSYFHQKLVAQASLCDLDPITQQRKIADRLVLALPESFRIELSADATVEQVVQKNEQYILIQMCSGSQEKVVEFHARIVAQVDKCGFDSRIKKRKIVETFAMILPKELRGSLTADTSAQQVVYKYNQHKLSQIGLKYNEDINGFHARLVTLANICGFASEHIKQQHIVNRLKTTLKEDLILDLLAVNSHPTAADILKAYEANQRFQKHAAWPHVLSHLNLFDMHNFAQSHSSLFRIVQLYVLKSHPLVIDEESVFQLHDKFGAVCKRYAYKCHALVLNGVPGSILGLISRTFADIKELTLIRVHGRYQFGHMDLRKLVLIQNSSDINDACLREQSQSLESLHLQGNDVINLPNCPMLSTLVLVKQRVVVESGCLPKLNRLTLDYCWAGMDLANVRNLRSLMHLKVRECVDLRDKEDIDDLKLTSTDINYSNLKQKSPLLLLNEYCLLHLKAYLSPVDWACLIMSHQSLFRLRVTSYSINKDSLSRLPVPEYREFFKRFGPSVSSVVVDFLSDKDFHDLFPYFTNVKELDIRYDRFLNEDFVTRIPAGLTKLTLDGPKIQNQSFMHDLKKRVEDTLLSLHIYFRPSDHMYDGEMTMCNIQELSSNACRINSKWLNSPRDCMRRLDLCGVRLNNVGLKLVCGMRYLTYLKMFLSCDFNETLPVDVLPNLEVLHITTDTSSKHFMNALDGFRIKSLTYKGGPNEDIESVICHKMINLEELEFVRSESSLVPGIFNLTKLRKLTVDDIPESHLLPMVQALPLLGHLQLKVTLLTLKAINETREYLKQANREMAFTYDAWQI